MTDPERTREALEKAMRQNATARRLTLAAAARGLGYFWRDSGGKP